MGQGRVKTTEMNLSMRKRMGLEEDRGGRGGEEEMGIGEDGMGWVVWLQRIQYRDGMGWGWRGGGEGEEGR